MELAFTVEGRCVPWQRTAPWAGRKLTPTKQRQYQRLVIAAARRAMPRGWTTDAPRYAVEVAIYVHPKQRLDADNGAKTILDALNKIAWRDDIRVGALVVTRRLDRERPRVEVCVVPYSAADSVRIDVVIGDEEIALTDNRWVGTPGPETRKAPRRSNARGSTEPRRLAR